MKIAEGSGGGGVTLNPNDPLEIFYSLTFPNLSPEVDILPTVMFQSDCYCYDL